MVETPARLTLLPLIPIPTPAIHDEFSYLLGAETFASGRITNPPHPMWVHFETFHVNQLPTYCSKYPPAQSLFLAFGQKFLGHPWFGGCLSVGLMFACVCWMLQGWVPPAYALLATLMGILEWGITSYWMNSYWGGAVAAAGGALVIGAVPRLACQITLAPLLLGSIGLVVLANSRPFEGALTAAAGVLMWWSRRNQRPLSALFRLRVLAPFLAVMVPSIAAMGYYNYRLTGSALLFPYALNQKTYAASPHLDLLPPVPIPVYRHDNLRKLWVDWDRDVYLTARAHPVRTMVQSVVALAGFYLASPLGIAALAGVMFAGGPVVTGALAILSLPMLGLLLAKGVAPHYLAPACGMFLILAAAGLQAMQGWRLRGRPAGPWPTFLLVSIALGICLSQIAIMASARKSPRGIHSRPMLEDGLCRQGGRHLVIVRYTPAHIPIFAEWVYNRADIDSSGVVWAQDMGEEKNRELLDYFHDRAVWLLQPDISATALSPFSSPQR